ncbi:MAG: OmpP1/FadL family transporter [Calditerrivibrio sp.]|nr:OmpP1/FadL family transporter [Calditerrivibrio sp.]
MKKILVALSFIAISANLAHSNGFQINEQGAKALGMGGAFVAQADDPSAVYFNPAGITQLEKFQFSAGLSPISPVATFKSDQTGKETDAKKETFYIPNMYATLKITDSLSFGLGIFANFGLATEWPDNWEGRYITGGTKAQVVSLTINPNIAYKLNKNLSVAAGINIQRMDITLENKVKIVPYGNNYLVLSSDGHSALEGKDDWGVGWNVALHYKITDNWNFGASYRSKIKHEFKEGTLNMTLPPAAVYTNTFTNTGLTTPAMNIQKTGSATLELPDIFYIGTSYKIGSFTFEIDGQWTGWSSYDKLRVDFEDGSYQEKPKNWNDSWAYRFGIQYKVNEILSLRAGIIRDETPIPDDTVDPLVPSGNRWLYALGFGLNFTNWTFDFAYNYLDDEGRRFNNPVGKSAPYLTPVVPKPVTGEFKDVKAHIFGINIGYKF